MKPGFIFAFILILMLQTSCMKEHMGCLCGPKSNVNQGTITDLGNVLIEKGEQECRDMAKAMNGGSLSGPDTCLAGGLN